MIFSSLRKREERNNGGEEVQGKETIFLVIPAYEPDERMVELLKQVSARGEFTTLVVDDGSGPDYQRLFAEAEKYAIVIRHESNQGKGCALKTAFKAIQAMAREAVVVTADADGQHQLEDITAVAEAQRNHPGALTLGSRRFAGKVPLKSRIGNSLTAQVVALSLKRRVGDTQTGLRAFDSKDLPVLLNIEGSRYEYEMNMLLYWSRAERTIWEEPIETIYLDDNVGSHFHPLRDSYQIYREIFKFSFSSGIGFLVDYVLYALLLVITKGMPVHLSVSISNILARVISAGVNYSINRKFVFKDQGQVVKTAAQYAALAVVILICNTLLLSYLVATWIPNQLEAKVVVELTLFLFSCVVQRWLIFRKPAAQGRY
ncbi:glycosyltransferase [Aminipila butyrica]|uniref:Glycosyltransferase n=1 Tax=Aminipila butyrica TaxID=433296 RepID=A0A858BWK4_9FIRM|nr:bifunctional glycosyltransferase family 2/GtrA family protein [Aminipila butyrica]QIB70313.1 glycosyltransferase [Aminipila butyrica]